MYIEIKVNQCRSDMSSLDPNKKAYCYGYVDKIQEDRVLIRDVCVDGVNSNEEPISFYIDHIWLFARGILKAVDRDKIQAGRYIRFRGKPYLYTRKDNTKDWAFNNCSNKQIIVISELKYRLHRLEATQ